jgi:nucleoside-triphosphatase THEP1
MKTRHYFLTGLPFVGKTTALLRAVQGLNSAYGFTTQSEERNGQKSGLRVKTSDGGIFQVAVLEQTDQRRIRKYSLDIDKLDRAVQNVVEHSKESKYIYLDEIGTLFCQSHLFVRTVRTLLETHTVLGVISRKGHSFIREIHQRQDCSIIPINAENRDSVPGQLLNLLSESN